VITHRKNGDSVVSVSREFGCGFLPSEVAPICACSFGKQMTSTNGTTSAKEILQPNSQGNTAQKSPHSFWYDITSSYKSSLKFRYL